MQDVLEGLYAVVQQRKAELMVTHMKLFQISNFLTSFLQYSLYCF